MESISFRLDVFEGPLDVLLNLISKHKLNIYDIEISKLLEQYMDFMDEAEENNLELAGEFLEMSARLIYIKTVSLLPKPQEAERLKKELEGSLIELSICKETARKLSEKFVGDDIFVRSPTVLESDNVYRNRHSPECLLRAYKNLSSKKIKSEVSKVRIQERISESAQKRVVPVLTKVVHILRKLYRRETVMMDELYRGVSDRSARVATFLAVLELAKSGRIVISDDCTAISFRKKERGGVYGDKI